MGISKNYNSAQETSRRAKMKLCTGIILFICIYYSYLVMGGGATPVKRETHEDTLNLVAVRRFIVSINTVKLILRLCRQLVTKIKVTSIRITACACTM